MVNVHIPTALLDYTHGVATVEASGGNIRAILNELDHKFPGIQSILIEKNGCLNKNVSIAVNGRIVHTGLYTKVEPGEEVVFFNVVTGG